MSSGLGMSLSAGKVLPMTFKNICFPWSILRCRGSTWTPPYLRNWWLYEICPEMRGESTYTHIHIYMHTYTNQYIFIYTYVYLKI
jgi:hypothetical protein